MPPASASTRLRNLEFAGRRRVFRRSTSRRRFRVIAGDPRAAFQVIMHALRAETVAKNNDTTLWIRSNYKPTEYTTAITETVVAGAPPYPMNPQSSLAHSSLGENISDFITGRESAAQSLADAAKAYRAAAREQGLIAN